MAVHKEGFHCSAKKSNYFIQIEYSTFRVQCWTLSFSNILNSEKMANKSSEALYIKQLYCFHYNPQHRIAVMNIFFFFSQIPVRTVYTSFNHVNSYLRMSVQISEMQFILGDELLSLL